MLNTRFNTANVAALGPILTTLIVGLDVRFGWGMGEVWMTAFAAFIMWVLTSITPDAGYTYKPAPANPNLKVVVLLPLLIMVLLILQGCSLAPGGGQAERAVITAVDTAREEIKAFNDKKAEVYTDLPCAISLGAFFRLTNTVEQEALVMLCSGKRPGEPAAPLLTPEGDTP